MSLFASHSFRRVCNWNLDFHPEDTYLPGVKRVDNSIEFGQNSIMLIANTFASIRYTCTLWQCANICPSESRNKNTWKPRLPSYLSSSQLCWRAEAAKWACWRDFSRPWWGWGRATNRPTYTGRTPCADHRISSSTRAAGSLWHTLRDACIVAAVTGHRWPAGLNCSGRSIESACRNRTGIEREGILLKNRLPFNHYPRDRSIKWRQWVVIDHMLSICRSTITFK